MAKSFILLLLATKARIKFKQTNDIRANGVTEKEEVGSEFHSFEVTPYFNHIQIWNFSLKLFKIDCFSFFVEKGKIILSGDPPK